jgi:hypothetical protein
VLGAVLLLSFVLVAALARRVRAVEARIAALTRGADGATLEVVIGDHLATIERAARDLESLATRTAVLERDTRLSIQRLGLVRYNPFEDTGGNQSFAVALLDANNTGVVVSSLHARHGTRIYAKQVTIGRSDAALSAEEAEALRQAMSVAEIARPDGGRIGDGR